MLSARQLTGRDDAHIERDADGIGLTPVCREALALLRDDAAAAGFDLRVVSGFRSFDRQAAIWNRKARGEQGVHDDAGDPVDMSALDDAGRMHAILRFSALPGSSRHHWGSDLDVYDAAAVASDYRVQLTPAEVADEGVFGPLHRWLDTRMAAGEAHGFYRPYDCDRGGVAPERWHLSFAPESVASAAAHSPALLRDALAESGLLLLDSVLADLPALYERYVVAGQP